MLHLQLAIGIAAILAMMTTAVAGSHHLGAIVVAASSQSSEDARVESGRGRKLFTNVWAAEHGAGPELNGRSCHACHGSPNIGGAGQDGGSTIQLSTDIVDPTGGHVVRQFLIKPNGRVARRSLPADSTLRRAPSLFGLGLLERVPEGVLNEYADPHDKDGDGISGQLARATGGVGRFGWKARFPTLDDAVAAAFVNELGLTTSRYPRDTKDGHLRRPELDDEQWRDVTAFVRSLDPLVPLGDASDVSRRGMEVFNRVGCAGCHRPTLNVSVAADQRALTIRPYTDLLLHDMGAALADGITEGDASPQEFRTPPLWGLGRTGPPYLHDGRAKTLHDAILGHGGEGEQAATAYKRLADSDRAALLGFVMSR